MTKDEAKTVFLNRGYVEVEGGTIYDADKWRESCRVISEWLEQEPCEDAISRQAAIDANCYNCSIKANGGKCSKCDVVKAIEKLSSVKPQEPSGETVSLEAFKQVMRERDIAIEAIEQLKELDYGLGQKIEPKAGHWIDADGDNAICGCCNRLNHLYGTYCKHCGAKMEIE